MTVFTCVTATLSPELASCMKAKGKTWKEAFFDSLKTLVGVEYTIYRRENQWQIKGEWDGIKKAYNILSKVAVIEKDAIAAYQAEALEGARARELASPATNPGLTDSGRRRRGRPPKKRPYIPIPAEEPDQETPLPPKRKRGRPRKVRVEEVKVESDIEDHEVMQSPNEMFNSEVTHTPIVDQQNEDTTNFSTVVPADSIVPPLASVVEPQADNSEVVQQQLTPEEYAHKDAQDPQNETPLDFHSIQRTDQTNNLVQNVPVTPEEPVIQQGSIESQMPKVEREVEMVLPIQEALDGRGQDLTKQPEPAIKPKDESLNDHFSDVAIAVAKEAIACASHHDGRPVSESTVTENIQTEDPAQSALQYGQPEQFIPPPTDEEPTQSATIFDYLGIKQKNTIDDFAGHFEDENERYSSEQSKKLEELIEKMIEKMDKTLKDPKPSTTGLKYICTECPFTSQKKAFLRDHMRKAHSNEEEAAPEETEPAESEAPLPPKKFLGPRKLYRCFECNYSSNSRKHLKEHKMRKHREKILECQTCSKKFAVERDLSRHMKEHEGGDVRYSCDVCGKKYKQQYVLKRHMETHEDGYIKPMYPCTQCSKTFAAKQVLQIHLNSVHLGKRPSYPCPTCGKTFTTKHSLAEHQLIHSNAKPYECTICKKAFRHESTLKTHQRLHTDTSQRFTCEYCGKAFRLRSSLRIHRNIHTGDKRFDCPICKKIFTQKQSLLRHARIHTGEKPFQCEICGSAFYDYSILRRHVTGVHKMQWKSPTQHYVLPPGSYQDGKVIEPPPQDPQVTQAAQLPEVGGGAHVAHLGEGLHAAALSGHAHHPDLQQHHQQQHAHQQQQQHQAHHQPPAPQGHVYQPPPMPHTPHTLPEPAHTSQHQPLQAHNLSSRHLQVADHQAMEVKVVSTTSGDQQHQQATYHNSIVSQNVYQPPHIPLPNTVPSAMPLTQPQPLQSPSPVQHHPQPLQSPPPPQHPMSPLPPMSPLAMAQFQQGQGHRTTPQTPLTSLPSAYVLNQQIYYQSHP